MAHRNIIATATMILLITVAFSGCVDFGDWFSDEGDWVSKEINGEYDADENTVLKVENVNGKVEIVTGDGNTIILKGEKKAKEKYEDELDDVVVNVTENPDQVLIEVIHLTDWRNVTTNMKIEVPGNVTVENVKTINGNIRVTGTKGNVTLSTTNGDITARGIKGFVNVSTTNGAIEVRDCDGVRDLVTVNNGIDAEIHSFTDNISIRSTNGKVTIHIKFSLDADIVMRTTNGKVRIHDLELDLTTDEDTQKEGILGDGGNEINIRTVNGDVDVYSID